MIDDWTTTTYDIECSDTTAKAVVEIGPEGSNRLQVQITGTGNHLSLGFNNIGDGDWRDFLGSLDHDYVATEARGLGAKEIDFLASCDAMIEGMLIQAAEVRGLDQAVEAGKACVESARTSYQNRSFANDDAAYDHLVRGIATATNYAFGSERDVYHLGKQLRVKPLLQAFIDDVWAPFCEQIKSEPAPSSSPGM